MGGGTGTRCRVVTDFSYPGGWDGGEPAAQNKARACCEELESGAILLFPAPPFDFAERDREFLLQQKWSELRLHKNVSYRPRGDVLRGFAGQGPSRRRIHAILRSYSRQVAEFAGKFLAPYRGKWILDFASFRPLEEEGRELPVHKRNDLLHVDAFPSRPTRGGRILRVFTNLNPNKPRVWETTGPFEWLAQKYANDAGLQEFAKHGTGWRGFARRLGAGIGLQRLGVKQLARTPYDSFMLRFHDYLKENSEFQGGCPRLRSEFAPLATWLVFTDGVAHAALSGQYALEQTFLIPPEALVAPERAPFRILERLASRPLV